LKENFCGVIDNDLIPPEKENWTVDMIFGTWTDFPYESEQIRSELWQKQYIEVEKRNLTGFEKNVRFEDYKTSICFPSKRR